MAFKGQAELNKLATKFAGDGKTDLIFVTDDIGTMAVFVGRELLADAKALAKRISDPCWVETKEGVYYDNPASSRRQQAEEGD